jgi:hypothetical protein
MDEKENHTMTEFNPDWACKPDCVANEALKEHLQHCNTRTDKHAALEKIAREMAEALKIYAEPDNWEFTVTFEDESFIRFTEASNPEEGYAPAQQALNAYREWEKENA